MYVSDPKAQELETEDQEFKASLRYVTVLGQSQGDPATKLKQCKMRCHQKLESRTLPQNSWTVAATL